MDTPEGIDPKLWAAIEHWVPKRSKLAKRVQRQMFVLYLVLVGAFVLLAWRTEVNAEDIRLTLWMSCDARAHGAVIANPGRETLAELLADVIKRSELPDDKKAEADEVLANGLIVNVADCGERP